MFKLWKKLGLIIAAAAIVWCGSLLRDRLTLRDHLIRLHVVANSDSAEDQTVKLQVRDAILANLDMQDCLDQETAMEYLQNHLTQIENAANEALAAAGKNMTATVSLCRESFPVRHYDSFSLPAGVYESLRVTLGEGAGKNWWCVVFPSLCYSASVEEFTDVAVGAGFSEELASSIQGKNPIEIRFFLLDLLGKLENMLFEGEF